MAAARSTETPAAFLAPLPDDLDGAQRALYAQIVGGARSGSPVPLHDGDGRLHGPFGLMLLSPPVGGPLQALGAALRFASSLDDECRETLILAVAAARSSEFEWYVHEHVARGLGMGDAVIRAIEVGDDDALPAALAPFARIGRSVSSPLPLSAARSLRTRVGDAAFFEAVTTAGYYALLADLLAAFEVGLPAGVPPRFASG